MSKQSERRDREFKELRSIAGLLKKSLARKDDEGQQESEAETHTGVGKFISTYKPAGGLVPWFFGLGIGAALNCLSADPRILYITWISLAVWSFWIVSHRH